MKRIFYITLLLLAPLWLNAQNIQLEGIVTDTSGMALPAANVVLLDAKDSLFVVYALTDAQGHFTLKRVETGKYLLQVSYLGHRHHWQALQVQGGQTKIDLGNIRMEPASTLLNDVEVTAERVPLTMSRDTLEYNAQAFKTQPGAVVEDLLKKLPGIQVQPDGTIKAQGKTVQNVLVEGKEFFGNDPKIATKNLPADAVNKVQVFDKKSEAAEFTGIEDGRDERTINLKLKDDKKQGYFGKANIGAGTEGRYEGNFNVNRFGRKTQMSALGMANNNNNQAFSFNDYINFMGGLGNFMSGGSGGGRMRLSFNIEDGGMPMGPGLDRGFTESWAGGANFNTDFSKRTSLSANYFYNRIENDLERNSNRINTLGDNAFNSTETEDRLNRNANHRLNLTLKHKLDSFQNLTFRSRLSMNDGLFKSLGQTATFNTEGVAENRGTRDYYTDGQTYRGDASLTWRRRFGKKGRALVANANANFGNDQRNGNLGSLNEFLQLSPPESFAVNQRQVYTDDANNYGGYLAYTEPLGKRRYLETRVEHQEYANNTNKNFYDRITTPTPGEVFNPLLSSQFKRDYSYDRAGLNLMQNREKYNLTLGAAVQHSQLDGVVAGLENPISRGFTRVLPSAFFNYDLKTSRHINLEYNTSLREPTLEQLQPAVDNSDPLNVYAGNPDLKPEYAHNLMTSFMNFDQFNMSSFFVSLSGTYTTDRITNAALVDSLFRRSIRPVNVKQDVSVTAYTSYNTPIRPVKMNVNLRLNNTYNRGILFVNDIENNTDRWLNSLEISFDNRRKTKADWTIGAEVSRNSTRYSVSTQLNQDFINQRYFGELTVFPTKKWALGTGIDCTVYSAENFGEQRIVPLWRASITRYVLKNNKGQLKLSAADLLNRNIGIIRTSQFNYLEEERVRNLARYFMLSFSYSLAGFKHEKEGIEIRM
ncbi:MAG: outer membrane beta-barrel protein [Chitinophagales bacterium]|nr:outer membrane beta-barrel protein [Chitinophagales bacterium]